MENNTIFKKIYCLSKLRYKRELERRGISDSNVSEYQQSTAFIQIKNSFDSDQPDLQDTNNVLTLWFDDVIADLYQGNELIAIAFTESQAQQLLEFLAKNKHVSTFLVHCSAGICRSGAVGYFINKYFDGDVSAFRGDNPHILPNSLVLRTLNILHFKEWKDSE